MPPQYICAVASMAVYTYLAIAATTAGNMLVVRPALVKTRGKQAGTALRSHSSTSQACSTPPRTQKAKMQACCCSFEFHCCSQSKQAAVTQSQLP